MSVLLARFSSGRAIALAVLALVVASVTYGFAASNTVPTGNAGDGTATISGYTVTNVKYNLNASDPEKIDSAQFSLAGPVKPSTVKARLQAGAGGSWYDCTSSSTASPYAYTCATPGATVAAANQLRVVAAD